MTILGLVGAIVAIITFIYVYFQRKFQYWLKKNVPYFTPSIPWGNMEPFNRKRPPTEELVLLTEEAYKRGWKYFGFYSTTEPLFVSLDLEILRCIMAKDFNHFSNRGEYYNEKDDPISAHIFAVEGTKWRNLRTKLTPTFTSGKLRTMFNTLVNCGVSLEDNLKGYNEMEPIDIKNVMACFTTDVIGSCAFGLECNTYKEINSPFLVYGKRIFAPTKIDILKHIVAVLFPKLARALHVKIVPSDISKFYYEVVTSTVNYREKNQCQRNDFLQLLIDMRSKTDDKLDIKDDTNGLTMNEIVAQCYVFFLAGYETSSTTMSFALYELATHPEYQKKVREEIFEVLKKYNNKVCYDALKEMDYMQQVFDETLRKYPPLPLMARQCVQDYRVPGTDIIIEKGTKVLIPIKAIHNSNNNYKDPSKFIPERFSPEEKRKRHPYSHIPFGEGPRKCIGMRFALMQSKVGLVSVLKNFEITLSSKTKTPIRMDCSSFTPSVDGGLWLNLQPILNRCSHSK